MGSADDRRFEVLRAIVADFVSTQEPIGSKTLVDRHNLGVSSATIRNDMAVLEAEGYIAQPHTSSGRVPTEKGYREFVDRLDNVKPLSTPERRAILTFLETGVDLDDVLRRSVRLLAQLTRQVAIVQYPTLSSSTVRHLEVVALSPARLLLVVITDSGRVDQRIVELGDTLDELELGQLRELLGQALESKKLSAASIAVADLVGHLDGSTGVANALRNAVGRSASVLLETLVEHREERLLMGGTANLTVTPPTSADPCVRCSRRSKSRSWCSSYWPPIRTPARSRCVSGTKPRWHQVPSKWPGLRWFPRHTAQ